MKLLYPLSLFLFVSVSSHAQTTTGEANVFTYDGSGRRILRAYNSSVYIGLKQNFPDTTAQGNSDQQFVIKAYPNPANDYITIENLSWKDNDKAFVKMFDATGRLVNVKEFTQAKDNISCSQFAPGEYELNYYQRNKLIYSWKMIKK